MENFGSYEKVLLVFGNGGEGWVETGDGIVKNFFPDIDIVGILPSARHVSLRQSNLCNICYNK